MLEGVFVVVFVVVPPGVEGAVVPGAGEPLPL